jgi:hypothetical protein
MSVRDPTISGTQVAKITSLLTQSIGEGCDKQLCAEEGF